MLKLKFTTKSKTLNVNLRKILYVLSDRYLFKYLVDHRDLNMQICSKLYRLKCTKPTWPHQFCQICLNINQHFCPFFKLLTLLKQLTN